MNTFHSIIPGRKRRTSLALTLAGIVLVCSVLAGCGQKTEIITQKTTPVSFSWWGNDDRHIYTLRGVDDFMKQNPDIDVSVSYAVWSGYETKMQIYMASHTESDVMQINFDWLSKYSPDGDGYYDMNQLSDVIDLSGYDDVELSYGIIDGKLNALPIAFNTLTMYYNQDILDQYGLETPKTWNDLYWAADKMKADGKYVLGISSKQLTLLLLTYFEQAKGKPFFNSDGSLNADKQDISDLFQEYKRMLDSHVLMPVDQFTKTGFLTGEVAGTCAWVNNASDFMDGLSQKGNHPVIGEYLRVNADDQLSGWYIKPATLYAISKDCEHPEAAGRLVNFLVNSKDMALLQKAEKGVPANQHAVDALEKAGETDSYEYQASRKMDEEKSSMKNYIPIMEDDSFIDTFKQCTDAYVYGDEDLNSSVDTLYNSLV